MSAGPALSSTAVAAGYAVPGAALPPHIPPILHNYAPAGPRARAPFPLPLTRWTPHPCAGGITYQRGALSDWIRRHGTDPVTGHALSEDQPYPNLNLRDQICGFFLVKRCMRD